MFTLPEGWSTSAPASDSLFNSLISKESSGDPNAVSPKGASGLAQLMPGTASNPGFGVTPLQNDTPEENARLGRDYLNAMLQRYNGDKEAALVAYNWGPGNADRWVAKGKNPNALPAETRGYVRDVLANSQTPMRMSPPDTAPQQTGFTLPQGWSTTPPQQAPQAPAPQPYQPTPWGEIANDAANGLISGGIGGLVGTAGMGADAARWLAQKAGYDPNGYIPSGEQIDQSVKNTIGDYSYTPTTGAGEITQTIGNMAPAAVGGGGGLARQGAQVLGTALASKAGGDLGRMVSPELGTVGDVAGALIGGHKLTAPTIVGKAPVITAADKLASDADMVTSPATEAIKRTSQEAYDAADAAGVQIKGPSVVKLQTALAADKALKTAPFDPKLHPAISSLVDQIKGIETAPKGPGAMAAITGYKPGAVKDISLEQFDNIRRAAVAATRSTNADERRMGGAIINQLDDFFNKLTPADVSSGDIGAAQQALSAARQNWRLFRKSEEIDKIMAVAKDNAGRLTVSGNENAIRQGFRNLSVKINRDPRTKALFTKDEIYAIRELSRGSQPRDALKNFAAAINNPLTRGTAGLGAATAMYYTGGDPTAAALAATGFVAGKAARLASGRIALKKANQLRTLVQSGGKLARSPGVTLPIVGNVRALPLAAGLLAANRENQ